MSCFLTLCSEQKGCDAANSFILRTISSSGGSGTGIRFTIPVFCRRALTLNEVVILDSGKMDGRETRVFVFMCICFQWYIAIYFNNNATRARLYAGCGRDGLLNDLLMENGIVGAKGLFFILGL